MFAVKVGSVVNMDEKKCGKTDRGPWCMVIAKSEKGHDMISIFATNPEDASNYTGEAVVKEIRDVSIKTTKAKNGEGWVKYYSISALLDGKDGNAGVKSQGYESFMQLSGGEDSLPFN